MTWSNEPPKDAGWYWIRRKSDNQESIFERFDDGEWWIGDVDWDEAFVARNYQFGPRIPTPEELEELSRDAKRWKTCERLAESQNHNREKLWTIRFVPGETFADAIDGEGV